jgi:NADH:ubiquinone oxidoreductase subunit E
VFDEAPLAEILGEYASRPGSLVPVLQATQGAYGFLPEPALTRISRSLRLPIAEVLGVATFYTQFHLQPRGEHVIRICHGTACHVRGASEVTTAIVSELGVEVGQTADDLSFTVESVACVGCCGLAPVVLIDEQTHGGLDGKAARKLAARLRRQRASR